MRVCLLPRPEPCAVEPSFSGKGGVGCNTSVLKSGLFLCDGEAMMQHATHKEAPFISFGLCGNLGPCAMHMHCLFMIANLDTVVKVVVN